jgi:ATP-dependent DNA ligase
VDLFTEVVQRDLEGIVAKLKQASYGFVDGRSHHRLKLHCVTHEVALQDFVTQAIEEKLGRKTRPKKGTA